MLFFDLIDPEEQIASEDFEIIESFLQSTGRTETGWHYITDLAWIYSRIKQWPRNLKILDAGDGLKGILQFLLAEMGFSVVNIDMLLLQPYAIYRERYKTKLNCLPSFKPTEYAKFMHSDFGSPLRLIKHYIRIFFKQFSKASYRSLHERWRREAGYSNQPIGEIQWVLGNLCHMPEIPEDSFDAIVSLSSLEHIPLNSLDAALGEILRVLKPDALWAVTTSATERPQTWFHEPSHGYCYALADLKKYFGAKGFRAQNAETILQKYHNCKFLREHLSSFYKRSKKGGMPQGIWDPKYIPVGIFSGTAL